MGNAKEIEAAAAAWFVKRDKGDWQAQDQAELQAWLTSDVRHRIEFIRVEAAWRQADRLKALGAGIKAGTIPAPGAWNFSTIFAQRDSVPGHRSLQRHRSLLRKLVVAAGILILVAGASVWFARFPRQTEYRTAVGGLERVPLEDGSTVTLNTNSEILVALTDNARMVKLPRGEAFFEVSKDPHRPFVVEAGERRVVAVGTKFSVWNEGEVLRIAVTEGHVRLEESGGRSGQISQLKPGDVARVEHDNVIIDHKSLDLLEAEELSWREGAIVFHDRPLGEAVREFNRYNSLQIVVNAPELANIEIGGTFRVTNIEAFIRLLEQGFSIKAVRKGDRIVLERS